MTYCSPICNPCGVGYGYGLGGCYGGVGSSSLVPVCGGGALSGVGGGVGSALSGIGYGPVNCSGQLSGSEVVIQPAPMAVTIPGPILSASGEPAAVAQFNPCNYGYPVGSSGGYCSGSSYGGYGRLGYGGGYCGGYGGGYGGWRRYSRKSLPFYNCGPC